jgi:hypothetical protein
MFNINSLRSGFASVLTIAVIAASSGIASAQTVPYSRDGVLIPLEQINPTDYPDAFYTGNQQPQANKLGLVPPYGQVKMPIYSGLWDNP